MDKVPNLLNFKSNEMTIFLDSFDTIITDCDGVLWLGNAPIGNSLETLKKLQSLGKKINFVSNNSTQTLEEYCEKFRRLGYPANPNQIVIPSSVICWYLKKLKFHGKAFVLGTNTFRRVLKAEGIDVVASCPDYLEENYEELLKQFQIHPDVKAVIVDLDVNVNWLKISKSIKYLKNPEVLYLAGGLDRKVPVVRNMSVLGLGAFADIISTEANREPVQCAKPGEAMKNYVVEKFELDDPSRCLFIGDTLESDMIFADLCGFRKLWVASGVDTIDTNQDLSSIPDYYLPSLGDLFNILNS